MKPADTVFVTIPRELLPDVLELVTDAYVAQQATLAKNEHTISDLQYKVSELQNTVKHLKEAGHGDDF